MVELGAGIIARTLGAVTAQTLANFPLSLGLRQIREAASPLRALRVSVGRPWLLLAITLLAVHFFNWMAVVQLAPLSVLVPLTAFSHVLNAMLAGPLLGEKVSAQRWAGTGLIVLGIVLVAG